MKDLDQVSDIHLIAACGLYCAQCKKYKSGKCPGCLENKNATWCKIRTCCRDKKIANCSDCEEYILPKDCKKYNNFIARTIELFSSSDRSLCIDYLRKNTPGNFAAMMSEKKIMSMSKKGNSNN